MHNLEIERARLRREALLSALYASWPQPLGMGLISASLTDDLRCSPEALERDLDYLQSHGQVDLQQPHDEHHATLALLTAGGVDAVEASDRFDTARRRNVRMLRLRVLQALDWGRPQPLGLRLLNRALSQDTDLDTSEPALRRAIAYLLARGMAVSAGQDLARITAAGIDYLAGDGDGIEGVARPVEW